MDRARHQRASSPDGLHPSRARALSAPRAPLPRHGLCRRPRRLHALCADGRAGRRDDGRHGGGRDALRDAHDDRPRHLRHAPRRHAFPRELRRSLRSRLSRRGGERARPLRLLLLQYGGGRLRRDGSGRLLRREDDRVHRLPRHAPEHPPNHRAPGDRSSGRCLGLHVLQHGRAQTEDHRGSAPPGRRRDR